MKTTKNYYIKKNTTNEYLAYNKSSHTAGIFTKQGLELFELLLKNENDITKIKSEYDIDRETEQVLRKFSKNLTSMNLFCKTDILQGKGLKVYKQIPKQINFYVHITSQCNLKCDYCYNAEYRERIDDLSLEQWKEIIDKIIPFAGKIIITGGEPTLNKNLATIIEYLKEKKEGIIIEMISNANTDFSKLTNFKSIVNSLNNLMVSVDNISSNDSERKGFDVAMFHKNIDYLKGSFDTKKITLASVLSNSNRDKIYEIKQFADDNNMQFKTTIRMPNTEKEVQLMPNLKECRKSVSLLNGVRVDALKNKKINCSAASTTFSISSNGDCYPCQNFHFDEFLLGNILKSSFKDIYNNKNAVTVRTRTVNDTKKCSNCSLKYVCVGGCISQTFRNEGSIFAFPKLLCPYYKIEAEDKLIQAIKSKE